MSGYAGLMARMYDPFLRLAFATLFGGESCFRQRIAQAVPICSDEAVLDVCCGTGGMTRYAASARPRQAVGIDASAHMLSRARDRSDASYCQADARFLPFADATFDKAYLCLALHEQDERTRREVLGELYRVLKPGGLALIAEWAKRPGMTFKLVELTESMHGDGMFHDFLARPLEDMVSAAEFRIIGKEQILQGHGVLMVGRK